MRRLIPSTTYQILLGQRNLGRWNKWDMWHVWRITEMCTGFRRGNMNQRVNLTDPGLGVLIKFKWFFGGQDGVACTVLICNRTQARGGPFQTRR